ncbi:MAG: alpha/beta fold hydrolase, partial [Chloroflexota bacterium]
MTTMTVNISSTNTDLSDFKPKASFRPQTLIANQHAQTILTRFLPLETDMIRAIEMPVILDAGFDETEQAPHQSVRMLGYYTAARSQTQGKSRGLVLNLHGWEGCSHSTYNISITAALLHAGYDVFRLNLRDHGPSYHVDSHALNPGVFMGTLLNEAVEATHQIAQMAGDTPFYIVGPSMGGNFALRFAIRHTQTPFHNLKKVIAICPAVQPGHATMALDQSSIYRDYFRRRWVDSLMRKQTLFPEQYDFAPIASIKSLWDMTEWLIKNYRQQYADADEYYQ